MLVPITKKFFENGAGVAGGDHGARLAVAHGLGLQLACVQLAELRKLCGRAERAGVEEIG